MNTDFYDNDDNENIKLHRNKRRYSMDEFILSNHLSSKLDMDNLKDLEQSRQKFVLKKINQIKNNIGYLMLDNNQQNILLDMNLPKKMSFSRQLFNNNPVNNLSLIDSKIIEQSTNQDQPYQSRKFHDEVHNMKRSDNAASMAISKNRSNISSVINEEFLDNDNSKISFQRINSLQHSTDISIKQNRLYFDDFNLLALKHYQQQEPKHQIYSKLAPFSTKKDDKLLNKEQDCIELNSTMEIMPNKDGSYFSNNYTIIQMIGKDSHSTIFKCQRKEHITQLYHIYNLFKKTSESKQEQDDDSIYIICYYDLWRVEEDGDIYLVSDFLMKFVILSICLRCEISDLNLKLRRFFSLFNDLFMQIDWAQLSIMEYLPINLTDIKKSKEKLDELDLIKILIDACLALKSIHQKNIAHLHIKPESILYSELGNYKLGDLDLSKILPNTSSCISNINNDGMLESDNDNRYLAPELLLKSSNDKIDYCKADVYSLGAIVYELMIGIDIYHENNDNKNEIKLLKGDFSSLENTNFSENLKKIIKKMLDHDANIRPTPNQIIQSLSLYY